MEEQKSRVVPRTEEDDDVIDLLELASNFIRIGKKIWWLFVALPLIGIGAMFAASYINYTPLYRCEATFTVSTGDDSSFYYSTTTADQMSLTFPYILDSAYFRSVLRNTLGTDTLNGTLTATTIANSNMVTMRAESPSAEDSRTLLDAAISIYPEVARFVLGEIEFHLIDEIQTPTAPYNVPGKRHILVYGFLGGLALASFIVGLLALFNNTVKTAEDVEKVSSLNCLGALPETKQKARKNSKNKPYVSILDPRTPHGFRESVRSLDVRLRDAMEAQNAKVLLVTSSVAGEGKSVVSINLAEQLAHAGKRVLLIDFDLRRQGDAVLLGCNGGIGVEEALNNTKTSNKPFIKHLKRRNMYFWGGTHPAQKPAAVLGNAKLPLILEKLREQVDYVILDTPPCGLFQDAAMLADFADAVLLVVRYDRVTQNDIAETLSMLDSRRAKILGYVLNAYPQTISHYGYGYGYGKYGYGKYGYGSYGSKYGGLSEENVEDEPELSMV